MKNIHYQLFVIFFKIGFFTIGGGYAMVPLIQNQIVDKKKWMSENEFMDTLAIAQSSPGPIAVNTAIFVGSKVLGKKGVFLSVLGAVLPSFFIILSIAIFFREIKDSKLFISIFNGIKPAVVALIFSPVVMMSQKQKINLKTIWIPIAVGILVTYTFLSPVFFIIAGLLGGNFYYGYSLKKREVV